MLLKFVLVSMLRNELRIFRKKIRNVERLIIKWFQNDTMIIKMTICNNAEIDMHV